MQHGDARETGPSHAAPGPGSAFSPAPGPGAYWSTESPQQIIDNQHLRLLRIGYFISAAQTAILLPAGLIYVGMGVMMSQLPLPGGSTTPAAAVPNMMSWLFGALGLLFTGFAALGTTLKVLTGVRLKERRSRILCLVTAAWACLEVPYGTALGVFTFIVLGRASVRQQFDG